MLVDQIIRIATAWRPRRGPGVDAASLVGQRVESVEAVGKHLLVTLGDRRVIHSHLGMTGSWHAYPRGAEWKKPSRRAALILETEAHAVINFSPKQLELVSSARLRRDVYLQKLGPDLLAGDCDLTAAVRRLRTHALAPIGVAVMDQSLVAGIGNVYKSEGLFLAKIDPWRPVGELNDERLLDLIQLTQGLMRSNLDGGMRTTRRRPEGSRVWVYGRRGEPCFACGGPVRMRRQGDLGRSTYWCPGCQPAGVSAGAD